MLPAAAAMLASLGLQAALALDCMHVDSVPAWMPCHRTAALRQRHARQLRQQDRDQFGVPVASSSRPFSLWSSPQKIGEACTGGAGRCWDGRVYRTAPVLRWGHGWASKAAKRGCGTLLAMCRCTRVLSSGMQASNLALTPLLPQAWASTLPA